MTKTLPNKPSDLAELALRDMRKAIRSPLYHISMGQWHDPNETCAVCAAGSIMAFTLNARRECRIRPEDFPKPTARKLNAIDDLRMGIVSDAFVGLSRSFDKGEKFDRYIYPYRERDRKPFFRDMRRLIKDLRAAGY